MGDSAEKVVAALPFSLLLRFVRPFASVVTEEDETVDAAALFCASSTASSMSSCLSRLPFLVPAAEDEADARAESEDSLVRASAGGGDSGDFEVLVELD
jgi:hypothetical protein